MTDKSKHTPGPWFPQFYDDSKTWGVRNALFAVCNLVQQDFGPNDGEEEATAALIARAPEMQAEINALRIENVKLSTATNRDTDRIATLTARIDELEMDIKRRGKLAQSDQSLIFEKCDEVNTLHTHIERLRGICEASATFIDSMAAIVDSPDCYRVAQKNRAALAEIDEQGKDGK